MTHEECYTALLNAIKVWTLSEHDKKLVEEIVGYKFGKQPLTNS